MIIKLKRFLVLIAKLLQHLNFLTLFNDQKPAKSRHRPFEQSLFLFKAKKDHLFTKKTTKIRLKIMKKLKNFHFLARVFWKVLDFRLKGRGML